MAPVIAQMSPASQGEGQLLKQGEIPSYAEHDDFLVKVPALKELLCRGGFRHRWPVPASMVRSVLHTVGVGPMPCVPSIQIGGRWQIKKSSLVRKFDRVERDHRNRSFGKAGEEFVVGVERTNSRQQAAPTSQGRTDGLPLRTGTAQAVTSCRSILPASSDCSRSKPQIGLPGRRFA